MSKTTYKPGLSFGDIQSYDFKPSEDLSFSIALTEDCVSISSITVKHEDDHILTSNTPIHTFKVGIAFNLSNAVSNFLWKEAAKNVQDVFQGATECTEELISELKERCNNTPVSISNNFVLTYGELNALLEEILALPHRGCFDDELIASAIVLNHAVKIWKDREENGCKSLAGIVENAKMELVYQNKLYKLIEELLQGLCSVINQNLRRKVLDDSFIRLSAMNLISLAPSRPAPEPDNDEEEEVHRNHDNPPPEFETLRSFARERGKVYEKAEKKSTES